MVSYDSIFWKSGRRRKMFKRFACLGLMAVILFVGSCGKTPVDTDPGLSEPTVSDSATTSVTETPDTEAVIPPLREKNMDGFTLRFSNIDQSFLNWANLTILTEQDGTSVNDAIYQRNIELEDTYNCKLVETTQPDFNAEYILEFVAAGSDDFDICMVYDTRAVQLLGYVHDWNQLSDIDITRPWWNPDATGVFVVDGKLYFTSGDMTLGYLSRAMSYLVNRDLYENLGLKEDLFSTVKEGKWTQDLFLSLAAQSVMDTDGDGSYTPSDTYGIFGHPRAFLLSLLGGAGVRYVGSDEDGHFVFQMSKNEKAVNLLQKMIQFMSANPNLYYNESLIPNATIPDTLFSTGQALFHVQAFLHNVVNLRDMENNFSILPLPKLDENQSSYYAPVYGSTLAVIPKTVLSDRYDNIGLLVEAMSRKTYENIIPQYKDVLLKHKTARDEESADMLDIIFDSITVDPGPMLWIGDIVDQITLDLFMGRNDAVVSYLESKTAVFQGLLDNFNEAAS